MPISDEQRKLLLPGAQPIGRLLNKWRQRRVTVYPTTDPSLVYTVGEHYPWNHVGVPKPDPIETIEPRSDYEHIIKRFPRMAVYE